ncbi:MAG: flagellar hook-length control protein FliK, partial [Gemmobacter sp.]
ALPGTDGRDFAALLADQPQPGPETAPSLPLPPRMLAQPGTTAPGPIAPEDADGVAEDDLPPELTELPPGILALLAGQSVPLARPAVIEPQATAEACDAVGGLAMAVSPPAAPAGGTLPQPPLDTAAPDWAAQLAARLGGPEGAAAQPTELTLELAPDHLGPLRLNIRMAEDGAQIAIAAATPEATRLLQDNAADLRRSLAEAGFSLSGEGGTSGEAPPQPRHSLNRDTAPRLPSADPAPPPAGAASPAPPPRRDAGLNLLA